MEFNHFQVQRILWAVVIFSLVMLVFNLFEVQMGSVSRTFFTQPKQKLLITEDMLLKGFFIRTKGCQIPEMKAMDASIEKYIFKEDEVICNNGTPALVESNLTSLYVLEPAFVNYKINETELFTCCYQAFYRVDPTNNKSDEIVEFEKTCTYFNNSIDINQEFVRVSCFYDKKEIYKDFFNFVPLKNTSEPNQTNKINVLMIGLDAVSKLNFKRQMPKTEAILRDLHSVGLFGYNKVGDNTFPNLIPVLTGLAETQLKDCWPQQSSYFDKCPFIWKKYKEAGYTTAFGEDSSWMGLFYYAKRGFLRQPTDYFFDHFDLTATQQIGNNHRLNVDQCLGSRSTYKVFLNYIKNFATTMHTNKISYFGFFWGSSLSHDYLNKPKLGDEDYSKLFSYFNSTGILNNTILIFMSDHGIRWGDIRYTYQGRMEERLPFLYLTLPDWYLKQHDFLSASLKTNKRRLTTPFDLHETLKDLIHPEQLTHDYLSQRNSNETRGKSLFSQISTERTCQDADISSHWCTCQTSKRVNATDPIVIEAANYTVHEHINNLLQSHVDCAVLELDQIIDASVQVNTEDIMKQNSSQDYTITFKTKPGGATFETTVRKYMYKDSYRFNITGTVSRLNLYGKQSLCMTDFHLKLYCYCKTYIP